MTIILTFAGASLTGIARFEHPSDVVVHDGEVIVESLPNVSDSELFERMKRSSDGSVVFVDQKPTAWHVWDGENWVEDLEIARQTAWAKAKSDRASKVYGGMTYNGMRFDTTSTSQSMIQGAVQLCILDPSAEVTWTLENNAVVTLSSQDVIGLGLALGKHVQSCFSESQAKRTKIDAANSISSILGV